MRSLSWIIVAIIIYGSLYPFDFYWPDFRQISWLNWSMQVKQKTTNGDILSNILTFIPLGYFAFFSHFFYKQKTSKRIIFILISGLIFAYSLQIAQFFLPSRVATASDAITNFFGIIIGTLFAYFIYLSIKDKPTVQQRWSEDFAIPLLLTISWLLYCWFPLFPNTQVDLLLSDISPIWSGISFSWHEWFFKSVFWACFYCLLEMNPWKKITLGSMLLISIAVIILKAIIAHNFIDINFIIAMLTGLVVAYQLPKTQQHSILLTLILLALLVKNLFPWQQKIIATSFNWIPFNYYLTGSMWTNTKIFLENIFSFGCLVYYANYLLPKKNIGIILAFSALLFIEILQMVLSFGIADITDPILALLIAYAYSQIRQSKMIAYSH